MTGNFFGRPTLRGCLFSGLSGSRFPFLIRLIIIMVRNQLKEIGVELTRAKRQVGTLIKVLETEIV